MPRQRMTANSFVLPRVARKLAKKPMPPYNDQNRQQQTQHGKVRLNLLYIF